MNAVNPFAPNPNLKVYLDGQIVPVSEARISVFDHGVLYGDGVFEGIASYNGRVFELDAHVRRLYNGAAFIRLDIPLTPDEMKQAVYDTLAANNLTNDAADAYIRLVVTRGVGSLGLSIKKTACPSVFIIADRIELYPREAYAKGMAIITAKRIRVPLQAVPPTVKALNYLRNILAKTEAFDAGVLEALMLNDRGEVAECTGDNIFIARGGGLLTPPISAGVLEGVTRGVVMRLAAKRGIEVEEVALRPEVVCSADECFLTGTAAEVVPVVKIDDRVIGDGHPGPVTRQLMADFADAIRRC